MLKVKAKNEGSILLSRVGKTDGEVAKRVGCSRPQVANYRLCKLKPRDHNRTRFAKEFGIPERAWDEPAHDTAAESGTVGITSSSPVLEGTARAEDLQRLVTALVNHVYDPKTKATPYEQAKVLRSATATLHLLGKLTGSTLEISEAKILRMPVWQRLKQRMLEALAPYPAALRAVAKALDEGS